MMNEADAVTTPSQLVDAVTKVEDAVANGLGITVGAAASAFVDAMKGKQNPQANAVRAALQRKGDESMGAAAIFPAMACVKAVCAANGRNDIQVGKSQVMASFLVTVNGETLSGDVSDTATNVTLYMRQQMR
jgi:hypothetical protein